MRALTQRMEKSVNPIPELFYNKLNVFYGKLNLQATPPGQPHPLQGPPRLGESFKKALRRGGMYIKVQVPKLRL